MKDVSKKYQQGFALEHISFSVTKGEILGIVGKSGSGKSTLLRLINLIEPLTEGRLVIDGRDTNELTARQVVLQKQKIGMVFQQFNLLANKTVAENVALPLTLIKQKDKTRVDELLDFVDMGKKKEVYPKDLSGGEKQRVALARALVRQPEILLCDEATSSLDEENTAAVLRLLKRIHQEFDVTILFVSHELDTVKKLCERVLVMEDGQLLGTVLNHPEPLSDQKIPYLEKVRRRMEG